MMEESDTQSSLKSELESLRNVLVQPCQEAYDAWTGGGGRFDGGCFFIAHAIRKTLQEFYSAPGSPDVFVLDIEQKSNSEEPPHSACYVERKILKQCSEHCKVDLPWQLYETATHAGWDNDFAVYNWNKIPGVIFTEDDFVITHHIR